MIIDGKKIAEDLRQNLKKEISNLKTSKKTDTDQRQVKTHDRSTYVEQANDITINHGSD